MRATINCMVANTIRRWSVLSKTLRVFGAIGCIVAFLWLTFAIGYYTVTRPHTPQPESSWTIGLSWTHPTSYGTVQEESRLIWCHWSFFLFLAIGAVGEMIKIYKLNDYSGIAHYLRNKPYLKQG